MSDSKDSNQEGDKKFFQLSARVDVDRSKDVHEAANAGKPAKDAVESTRTNKSSGSAGGDQFASVEIDFGNGIKKSRLEPGTEQSVLAQQKRLEFLEQDKLVPSEMRLRMQAVLDGRNQLIEGCYQRPDFDAAEIKPIADNIAKDDVGSALALYVLGPDTFRKLGAQDSKSFGDKFLVFGLAPMFGACEKASDEWENNKAGLGVKGSTNFYLGTVIGALLERAHPIVGLGALGVGGTLAVNDLALTPEAQERNGKLVNLAQAMNTVSPEQLIQYAQHTKRVLGPPVFEALFDTATGGVGIPTGNVAKAEIKEKIAEGVISIPDKKAIGEITLSAVQSLDKMGEKTCQAICGMFGWKKGDEWALAGGGKMPVGEAEPGAFERFYNMMIGKGRSEPEMTPNEHKQLTHNSEGGKRYAAAILDVGKDVLDALEKKIVVSTQHNDVACVAASGEMICREGFEQGWLIEKMTELIHPDLLKQEQPFSLEYLKMVLGKDYELTRKDLQESYPHYKNYAEVTASNAETLRLFAEGKEDWIAEIKVGLQMAHEVVIHKCENGILYVKDPSFGRYYAMKVEDFAQFWNGRAMIYNPKKGP